MNELLFYPGITADILHCLQVFLLYIIPCVIILLLIRGLTHIPQYVFRKCLHLVAFTCVTIMISAARSWQAVSLVSVMIALVIYPILYYAERYPQYSTLFVEKRPGEIRRSLLFLFFMFAFVTALAWGVFDRPDAAAASVLMWGTGDAAAALTVKLWAALLIVKVLLTVPVKLLLATAVKVTVAVPAFVLFL